MYKNGSIERINSRLYTYNQAMEIVERNNDFHMGMAYFFAEKLKELAEQKTVNVWYGPVEFYEYEA